MLQENMNPSIIINHKHRSLIFREFTRLHVILFFVVVKEIMLHILFHIYKSVLFLVTCGFGKKKITFQMARHITFFFQLQLRSI